MSWVSLADEIGAIKFLIDHDDRRAVNLTGPAPVSNSEFTHVLGEVLGRPTVFPVPSIALRIVLGEFSEDVLSSANVLPKVLLGAGFTHQHQDVTSALRWALAP